MPVTTTASPTTARRSAPTAITAFRCRLHEAPPDSATSPSPAIVEREEPAFTVSGPLPDATPETLAPYRHWLEAEGARSRQRGC